MLPWGGLHVKPAVQRGVWVPTQHLLYSLSFWSSSESTVQFVPHRKHYVSATKPNRLMLFREIIAVYCENHTEHINTLCGQNAVILMLKQVVHMVTTVL
jgi:hypothetical protein